VPLWALHRITDNVILTTFFFYRSCLLPLYTVYQAPLAYLISRYTFSILSLVFTLFDQVVSNARCIVIAFLGYHGGCPVIPSYICYTVWTTSLAMHLVPRLHVILVLFPWFMLVQYPPCSDGTLTLPHSAANIPCGITLTCFAIQCLGESRASTSRISLSRTSRTQCTLRTRRESSTCAFMLGVFSSRPPRFNRNG
jgi:hypothetical protein